MTTEPHNDPGVFPANPWPPMGGGIIPSLSGPGVVNGNEGSGIITLGIGSWVMF